MSKYKWLIDAGHGGMLNDRYVTAPSKMFTFDDGMVAYEGVINRGIADKMVSLLDKHNIRNEKIYEDVEDDSLMVRVIRADAAFAKDKSCIFLSIHSNAGGGSGFEVWTSKGQTKSDMIAEIFWWCYSKYFPDFKLRSDRSDGDADKEAEFYVLRKTDCPAVLVENLFFDNRKEAEFLNSKDGQWKIAECLFRSILEVEKINI